MYYDLNVPYVTNQAELQRTLAFLADCKSEMSGTTFNRADMPSVGYNTIALEHTINGKIPAEIVNEIPVPLPFSVPPSLRILRRCTLYLTDTSQNHRLSHIAAAYDIFVIRPTNEIALGQALLSLECDLVSLDLCQRFPFYFKHKPFSAALRRGIKFEICYAPGILNSDGGASRRNLISNATQLVRVTRGIGLVVSSEAKRALACRAPADVVNLCVMWGLAQERALEAVTREARNVVVQAGIKRSSFRGVIDIIHGGNPPIRSADTEKKKKDDKSKALHTKRTADAIEHGAAETIASPNPPSKREQKRQAKKARLGNGLAAVGAEGAQRQKDDLVVSDVNSVKPT